jgi:hypothetical protein
MNIHKNARLTPVGRERIVMQVESGQTPQAAARAARICRRKWVAFTTARTPSPDPTPYCR